MLATSYPMLNIFLSILWFFLFFIWIYTLIAIFSDIFRSPDLAGISKAVWFIFVLVLPFLGAFVYLIARGGKMHEHAVHAVEDQQAAFRQYVQNTVGTNGGSGATAADQLAKLADLRDRGVLTSDEFAQEKAKLIG